MLNKRKAFVFFLALFFLSRWYVLSNPPFYYAVANDPTSGVGYSDVKHDSERYANMWHYGLTPYLEHLYEYPPAAIPIVYLPLLIDLAGFGHYYINYRVGIFLLETIVFIAIYKAIEKYKVADKNKTISLLFYIGAGMVAKDYWYEGLDLAFVGVLILAMVWRQLKGHTTLGKRIVFWTLFWLSVAIKFMSAPLLVLFLWLERKKPILELKAFIIGFLIIWLIPLVVFRSSLSVMFYFHNIRPIKAESFARFVIDSVNIFTKSDYLSDIAPHFPMVGPVSDVVTKVVAVAFPAGMGLYLIYTMHYVIKRKSKEVFADGTIVGLILIYIFVVFLTGKIFSNPFHIWYVPLITILPFKDTRKQLLFMSMAVIMLLLDTTPLILVPNISFNMINLGWIRGLFRFIPMFILLFSSIGCVSRQRKGVVTL